jgi:[1-hydroxy-2-(trimethylamino)ethyl]phosphonate dioxygenase
MVARQLVAAALLHDIGHLVPNAIDTSQPHGELAADLLRDLFSAAVTMPIRYHVAAKRYLCVADPHYWSSLSPASQRSLEWQGGAFTVEEAHEFIALPFAEDAVNLRLWDDAAKVAGAVTENLDFFLARLGKLQRSVKHTVYLDANRSYS